MKIPTLVALSILGMAITSMGVWVLTAPGEIARETLTAESAEPVNAGPGPEFEVAGPVTLEGRLGHDVLPANQPATTYVFSEMTATARQVARTPAPLNLAIVIDRSGSMRGRRLQNAIDAAQGAVRRLRDGDQVSVITYNTLVADVVPPTIIDASTRGRVVAAIGDISAAGDTCISCGIESGLARMRGRTGMVQRILLLSDGEATAGIRDEAGFKALAIRCRESGTSITTIGVDTQYNERVMAVLALESNGRHHFVENAAALPAVFDQELAALNETIAMDAEVIVTPAPGVSIDRVFDRGFRRDGNQVVVPLGTFAASEKKTLLIALHTPPNRAGILEVARIELRYRDLTENTQQYARGELALSLSADPEARSDLDLVVENRLSRSQASDALEEANALFRAGKKAEARQQLQAQLDSLTAAETRSRRKSGTASRVSAQVGKDYQRQRRALEDADDAFAESASPAPSGPTARPKKKPAAQVRANQDYATESRF